MSKKKSTAEIIAQLRGEAKQGGGQAGQPPVTPAAEPPSAPPAAEQQAPESHASADEPEAKPATPAPAAPRPAAKPAAPGGKPKSTKDILAALRAEAGGDKTAAPAQARPAAKAAAATGPAGAKPARAAGAAAPAATATADRPRPSVQEMLRAAREGQPLETPATAKPAAPPKPKIPAAARRAKDAARESGPAGRTTRRGILLALILTPFALAWWLFGAASVGWALALARFMMPNVLVEPPSRFKIGPPSDYPPEMVSEKWKAEYGIWVVNTMFEGQQQIYALISVCTHLGCTPNWLQGEQKFKCPCHGSGFYISGINFEGPAPRPLERAAISIAPDGMLEVDKSRKFQQEMGQWADATSYVPVV